MARINMTIEEDPKEYFAGVDKKLTEIGATRSELARQLEMSEVQLSRLFSKLGPQGPTYATIFRIERGLLALRRSLAQKRKQ